MLDSTVWLTSLLNSNIGEQKLFQISAIPNNVNKLKIQHFKQETWTLNWWIPSIQPDEDKQSHLMNSGGKYDVNHVNIE